MTEFREMARKLGLESEPKIFARFFDNAIEDIEASKKSGRKRFRPVVYIELRNMAESVPDVFHRKLQENDKQDYPQQWAHYLEAHKDISNRAPSLKAIPGMTIAAYEEFKALELWDCEKVADYPGDLENLEQYRSVATQIMRISHDEISKKRKMVRNEAGGQVHDHSGAGRAAEIIPIQKESEQKEGQQEEESFRYEFKVSM